MKEPRIKLRLTKEEITAILTALDSLSDYENEQYRETKKFNKSHEKIIEKIEHQWNKQVEEQD